MGEDYSLVAMVKVIVYGVPALLILLGFFAYVGGYTVQVLTGDVGMKSFGMGLMAIGVIIYLVELAFIIYSWFSE